MRNHNKRYFKRTCGLFLLTFFVFAGCQDFLERKPQGQLLQSSFPVSASDALLTTNAAYASLRNWHFHSGGFPILDIMSDDARKGSNPADAFTTVGPYDNFTINSKQDGLDRWWTALYQGIRTANVVITYAPTISMSDSLKSQYTSEAKFLRGLIYFDMVRAWGGVQLVTSPDPPLGLGNATQAEIYTQVIDDLTFAAGNLPEQSQYTGNNLGRATRGAAKAYLAKVYLFRNDFVNAEKYALEVINSGQYSLEPDFNNANGLNGNFGDESIFEIGAQQNEGVQNGGDQFANTQGIRGTPNRGWGFNRPSVDLINSFEANDPRKDATVIFLNEVMDGVTTLGDGPTPDTIKVNNVITEIECYNQKIWMPGNTLNSQWGHHRRLMRYADVLLIAAEASNENAKPVQALLFLNEVRERARGGNITILPDVVETNKDLLRDIILNERRHELALEGHRFWDLVRTGKAPAILGPLGFVANKYERLPIPQTQIDISQGNLKQNDGWNN